MRFFNIIFRVYIVRVKYNGLICFIYSLFGMSSLWINGEKLKTAVAGI